MSDEPQVVFETPDAEDLRKEAAVVLPKAQAFEVTTKDEQEEAQKLWKHCGKMEKKVNDRLNPIIDHMNKAHKGMTGLRAELKRPFKDAKEALESTIGDYEAKARREAEEKAAKKAQEEREKAEKAQELAALQAEAEGDKEAAEEIINEPLRVPSVQVEPEVAKVAGVSKRKTWYGEVTDMKKLVQYIAKNPEWVHLVEPAQTAINGLARSMKGVLNIPGIKAREKSSLVGR